MPSIVIPQSSHGERIDKALTLLLLDVVKALSRARLQALIAEGNIALAGKPITDTNYRVKEGQVFEVNLPDPKPALPEAQAIVLKIVFEDKDLLVIDKPPGMVVHPAPGNRDRTLVNALLSHCGSSLSGIGGVARPGIVHRLDKDTSGLIVVAKNDEAHQALSKQFADRTLSRTYAAFVWGVPVPRVGQIDLPVGRHPVDRKRMAVTAKGKAALTFYKVLEIFEGACLVECKLATGRTHQIRVHLSHLKHPVIGDPVYGKRKILKDKISFNRQALHAAALQFRHPRTGKLMKYAAPLPKDMKALLKKLRATV